MSVRVLRTVWPGGLPSAEKLIAAGLGVGVFGVSVACAVRAIVSEDPEVTLFLVTVLILAWSFSVAGVILAGPARNRAISVLFFVIAVVWLVRGAGPLRGMLGEDLAAAAHPVTWALLIMLLLTYPRARPTTRAERVLLTLTVVALPLLIVDSWTSRMSPTDPCLLCLPSPDWRLEPFLPLVARAAALVVTVGVAVELLRRGRSDPVRRPFVVPALLLCTQFVASATVPLVVQLSHPVWLIGNGVGVMVQIVIAPIVLFTNARGWRADAELWERRYAVEAEQGRRRARTEIERDLHDGAQVRLINAALLLKMARKTMDGAGREANAHLDTALQELSLALADLRMLCRGARPPALGRGDLHGALVALARNMPVAVRIEGRPRAVPLRAAEVAYFTVAEALSNSIRHGEATTILIRLRQEDEQLHLEIADDGNGEVRLTPDGGLELLGRRAGELGGSLHVESEPGAGTTVRVVIPCALSLQTTRS